MKSIVPIAGVLLALLGCERLDRGTVGTSAPAGGVDARGGSEVVKDEQAKPTAPADQAQLVSEKVQGYLDRVNSAEQRSPRTAADGKPEAAPGEMTEPPQAPSEPRPRAARSSGPNLLPGGWPASEPPLPVAPPTPPTETKAVPNAASITAAELGTPPPVLASVSVRAAPAPAAPAKMDDPAPPRINAPAAAHEAPPTLDEFLKRWPADGDGASFRGQLDARVLRVVAGEYEKAREPLSAVSKQQQEMAARFIESLIAIREAHDGDPTGAASRVLEEVERLRDSLTPLGELKITTFAICREVTGYGQYRAIDPPTFRAGVPSEFVAYAELTGYVSAKQDDGTYESRFDLRTRVLNSAGEAVVDLHDTDLVDRCRQQRRDCFIPRLVCLPANLPPGEYVAKVTVVDKLGEKVAENRATFRVASNP